MPGKSHRRMIVAAALAAVALILAGPARAQSAPHASSPVEKIDALVSRYHEYGLFNGAVLVAEEGKEIYGRGFGDAVMEWDVPNTTDTKFRIGSVTKQFTAAIVLQLVEEGRMDLQGKITDYLPDYPPAQGDRVTIHHLLTHTSGIPSYTDLPGFMETNVRNPYEPADSLLPVFASLPLEFEPGSQWQYSNSGYHVLGVIIEHVTGKPYDQVLRERILDPLGLEDTGYDHYGAVVERKADGYVRMGGEYRRAPYLDTSIPFSEGMLYSTPEDLLKWDQALYGKGPFRDPDTRDLYVAPHAPMQGASGPHYAYGWTVHEEPVGTDTLHVIEHGGGIFGFTTAFWRIPEEHRTVIVMDNTSGSRNNEIVRRILAILHGQEPPMPSRPVADYLESVVEEHGLDAAVAGYRAVRDTASDRYDLGEDQLNTLGYLFLRRGEVDAAIRIFRLNVEAFPDAWNTYDSLAEAYLEAGDREQAIANYRTSLERNPLNDNGKRMLRERLGVEVEDTTVEVPEETLERYVGRYGLAPGFEVEITREGTQLYAQATGQERVDLIPLSPTEFLVRGVDARLTFHGTGEGIAESVTLHQNGREVEGARLE